MHSFALGTKTYKIGSEIGSGSYSKVYKIIDDELRAVVKIIDRREELCEREISILESLSGKNGVVKLYDHGVIQDKIYLVLEEGISFIDYYNAEQPDLGSVKLLWGEAVYIVSKLHDERIIHNDIKPDNFIIVNGRMKIIDFGFAIRLEEGESHKEHEHNYTAVYAAPERRRAICSFASDVWLLGALLYELLTAHEPFGPAGWKEGATFKCRRGGKELNAAWDAVKQCLQVEEKNRPTAKELLNHPFLK